MSDLISRQAVIELVKNSYYNLAENMDDVWAMVKDVEQIPSTDRQDDNRLYIKIYADDEPSRKVEKLYQICGETENQEVAQWLKEYFPSADRPTGWIPVKWHEITDEEREREGYPKDWVVYIDCEMPCDEQEILVQTKNGYIRWDVCYEDGEFSLDSGWNWADDIVAWMPLPEPYKGGDDDG